MLGMLGDTRLEFASMTEAQLKEEVQTGLKLQDEYDRLLDQLVACYKRIVEGASRWVVSDLSPKWVAR